MRKQFLLLTGVLSLLTQSALAATTSSLTIIDTKGNIPSGLFLFIFSAALVSLWASYKYNDEMCGFISIMTTFTTMWTSRGIDYVSGAAIDTTSVITVVHTIYHPEIISVMALICFILSILNIIRLYALSKQTPEGQGQ